MVDALDLLQCPICGTFYVPEVTVTGRTRPHCWTGVTTGRWSGRAVKELSKGEIVELRWMEGEAYIDWEAAERRVLERYGLTDVVEPPLTGKLLDVKV